MLLTESGGLSSGGARGGQTSDDEQQTSAEMTLTLMSLSTLTTSTRSPGRSFVRIDSLLNGTSQSAGFTVISVFTARLPRPKLGLRQRHSTRKQRRCCLAQNNLFSGTQGLQWGAFSPFP